MAKKKSVNKSQAIRDALNAQPDASPKQLSAELSARGIKASPTYISVIKYSLKRKGAKKGARPVKVSGALVAADLLEAKKLVDRVGGIENVQSLLGTLKKLI